MKYGALRYWHEMIVRAFALFFFFAVSAHSATRIVWWNIQYGKANRAVLEQSLLELAHQNIDVLVLGEFERPAISDFVISVLRQKFPFSEPDFFSYSDRAPERGMYVFSRIPWREEKRVYLDYVPPGLTEAEKKKYRETWAENFPEERYFERYFHKLSFEDFILVPVHLCQPVEKMLADAGKNPVSRFLAKYEFGFGKNNPIYHQAVRLREQLDAGCRAALKAPVPTVLIGDFNMPTQAYLKKTQIYQVLSRGFVNPFEHWRPTWPVPGTTEASQYKGGYAIDWGLVSPTIEVRAAKVLPMPGSDHFPILLEIK